MKDLATKSEGSQPSLCQSAVSPEVKFENPKINNTELGTRVKEKKVSSLSLINGHAAPFDISANRTVYYEWT